ncbi:MAG: serine hydrolase domain-containing protein [Acidobacteriota bacterium]
MISVAENGYRVEHVTTGARQLAAVEALIERAVASDTTQLTVLHRDRPLLRWRTVDRGRPLHVQSITKSFVALAILILRHEGKLTSLDQPVGEIVPAWADAERRAITVRHLLLHISGLDTTWNGTAFERSRQKGSVASRVLDRPVRQPPGQRFAYDNAGYQVLALVAETLAGESLATYLDERLFTPLEIDEYDWLRDEEGHVIGPYGLSLHADALAKVGACLAAEGKWRGDMVLPPDLVEAAIAPRVQRRFEIIERERLEIDGLPQRGAERRYELGEHAYGYGWWHGRTDHPLIVSTDLEKRSQAQQTTPRLDAYQQVDTPHACFSARGEGNRTLIVVPELQLVAARLLSGDLDPYDTSRDDLLDLEAHLELLTSAADTDAGAST